MILKNASVLAGPSLRHVLSADVLVQGGRFVRVGGRIGGAGSEAADCEGLLAVPGMVNCHTHIGDAIAKDAALGQGADEAVHPVGGLKPRVLKRSRPEHLASFMRAACVSMIRRGITTFVDFREGGIGGAELLYRAASGLPIRAIVLGRIESYHDRAQVRANVPLPASASGGLAALLRRCDGLGLSGANENSSAALRAYSQAPKLRAIHAAETAQSMAASRAMTGRSEVMRALQARPGFLVHMTHAGPADLRAAARRTRGIVVCPRANASLAEGLPDIVAMMRAGCRLAIGTDNVMINSPDMFREMDYLWKATMAAQKKRVDPRQILMMATANAGRLLRRRIGCISPGYMADFMLVEKRSIDLDPMHSPYAAIVHRASESSIRAVIIGGKVVHGRI